MKWRGWLNDGQHRTQAEEQLAAVTDLRAVIAVQRVFWTGWVDYQARAVRLFGQIDAPESTRALAKASGYCDDDAIRTTAVALLKTRPPQDYIETLVDMIHTPATYAIEPVQGPGSKGVLVVDTPRYHLERSYNAPLPFKPGFNFDGYIGYDLNGLPIAVRGREIKEGISLEAAEYRTMEMILSSQANAIATQKQLEEDARGSTAPMLGERWSTRAGGRDSQGDLQCSRAQGRRGRLAPLVLRSGGLQLHAPAQGHGHPDGLASSRRS